ncbi:hypothetical protein GWK47_049720 [Chionoecetes opilio]|uniref:Uncharacterized protein n=1 Tax=Chionoecetes opilio TaxID=41210 RepID=A0A8J5CT56_CHIOP|nr:hypothetical protein GWK47_049720 [Chionoecetes opilio]
MSAQLLDLGPCQRTCPPQSPRSALSRQGDRAASRQVMARHVGTLPRSSSAPLLFARQRWSEEKRAIVSAMQQGGWGEEPPRRRRRRPRALDQRFLASFATTTLSASSPPSGAGHDFLNVDPAEWSGRGRLHHGSSGAPVNLRV